MKSASTHKESKLLWPPLVIAIFALWILPLTTSLGLDEAGTWWVVKDGAREAMRRAHLWPAGLSVLFDLILTGVRALAGDSDVVMRLPALAASIIAVLLLYRLALKFAGPVGAMFACLVFVVLRDVVYVASTVRPYALGLAFVIGAMLALCNWIDTGRWRYGAVYCVLAGLMIHAHFFLAEMFLVHAIYISIRMHRRNAKLRPVQILFAACGIAVVVLPLIPFMISLNAARLNHVYLPTPSAEEMLAGVAPPLLTGMAVLALLLWMGMDRGTPVFEVRGRSPVFILAVWALAPVLIVFLVSAFSNLKIFAPRYYICSAPGFALLAGFFMDCIRPNQLRLLIATVMLVASIVVYDVDEHAARGTVDFRALAAAINERGPSHEIPVLAVSGFAEAASVSTVLEPALSDVFFSPYLRYSIHGNLIRLPFDLDPPTQSYLDGIVRESLATTDQFFVAGFSASVRYNDWLEGRMKELGFSSRLYGNYGGVALFLFERRSP